MEKNKIDKDNSGKQTKKIMKKGKKFMWETLYNPQCFKEKKLQS
jgi:hypothetical protein